MSDFSPLNPSFQGELPPMQTFAKKTEEDVEQKKFESELEKQRIGKTDADQKKQRKREQEENQGSERIVREAQDLIEQKESLYAIEKTDMKTLLKKKRRESEPEKPFVTASLDAASLLFEERGFSLNLSASPADRIEKHKKEGSLTLRNGSEEAEILLESVSVSEPGELFSDPFSEEFFEPFFQAPVSLPPPPLASPPASPLAGEEEKRESKAKEGVGAPAPKPVESSRKKSRSERGEGAETPFAPFVFYTPGGKSPGAPALRQLSPELFAVFERMAGVVTLLQTGAGVTKTTIHLNQPQFASSIFFGCRITIEESQSAPKEFTIEFTGSPLPVEAFAKQKKLLEKAFAEGFSEGSFRFKVQRIEASLSSD